MGYVVEKDGKYLQQREATTHTGHHVSSVWVEYLDDATVFYRPKIFNIQGDFRLLDAKETRTVSLTGQHKELPTIGWQPIATAPKDRPILGWCVHSDEACVDEERIALTLYGAHIESLSHVEDGPNVLVWGGAFDDSTWETPGVSLPDWWFLYGSDFEVGANPTHWMPIPEAPSTNPAGTSAA